MGNRIIRCREHHKNTTRNLIESPLHPNERYVPCDIITQGVDLFQPLSPQRPRIFLIHVFNRPERLQEVRGWLFFEKIKQDVSIQSHIHINGRNELINGTHKQLCRYACIQTS